MPTFKKLLSLINEEGAMGAVATVMAGDVAQFTPVMSAGKKNKRKTLKKAKDIVDEASDNKMGVETSVNDDHAHYVANLQSDMVGSDGSANITSTMVNKHTHTVSLTAEQVKKILDQRQVRTHTSSDDGHTHEVVFMSSKKLEELIEEIMDEKTNTKLARKRKAEFMDRLKNQAIAGGYANTHDETDSEHEARRAKAKAASDAKAKKAKSAYRKKKKAAASTVGQKIFAREQVETQKRFATAKEKQKLARDYFSSSKTKYNMQKKKEKEQDKKMKQEGEDMEEMTWLSHNPKKASTSKSTKPGNDSKKGSQKFREDVQVELQQESVDENMIEQTDTYKYFLEGEKKVFEIVEESDFNVFIQGLKRNNPRFWRTTPTNEKMMEKMNENRGLWFEVRFGDRSYKPFDKRF